MCLFVQNLKKILLLPVLLTSFLGQFYWVLDLATNYVTSLHIASFSILRFVAIKWPFFSMKITEEGVVGYVIMLWVLSILLALPAGHWIDVGSKRGEIC